MCVATGFSTSGATEAAVRTMKLTVGNCAQVKASGGIRTAESVELMRSNGADRIGTSSGVAIVTATASNASY